MNWDKIVKEFKEGASIYKLSNKYSIPYKKINAYLIENKIKTVTHAKIPKETIDECIEMIKKGYSVSEIKNKLSITPTTIHIIASENNIEISKTKRNRTEINSKFIDNYFEVIDTEEKAYFLGLIYADGNVREHNNGYFLSIELLRSDKYILERLASELQCGNKIYDRDRITNFGESHMSNFTSCNSKKLYDDLSRFNIIQDKSHITTSFKNIEELIPLNLIRHFLRGLVDGDGTISKRFTTFQNAIAIYQNTIDFCNDFDRLLRVSMNDDSIFSNISLNKNSGVYNLRYRRINDVQRICNHLYNNSTIYLKRKYNLAKLYFSDLQESQLNDSLLLCSNQ